MVWLAAVAGPGMAPQAHADRSYVVRSGDTLARIARRFRTNISDLKRANRLRGDSIRVGARLTIPGRGSATAARRAGYHVVRRGDSLARIARRYRVSVRALKHSNRLRGDVVRVGERLRIPGRRAENRLPRIPERALRTDQTSASRRAERLSLGTASVAHTLLGGPGPEPAWLAAARTAPRRIPSYAYGVGTPIVPRDDEELAATDEAEEETPHDVVLEDDGGEGVEEQPPARASTARSEANLLASQAPPTTIDSSQADTEPSTDEPSAGPGTLRTPIDAAVFLRGWGSGAGGYHLALDLYAPPGTPVLAAERGVVAYEGHGLRGYGRMVVVLHPSGRVTAYAHNRETLVVAGELVARGQVIALLGNTGISRGPHVHFMLVDGGEHCDALPLLRPRVRWRNETLVETDVSEWTRERPQQVRCLPRSSRPHPGRRRRR